MPLKNYSEKRFLGFLRLQMGKELQKGYYPELPCTSLTWSNKTWSTYQCYWTCKAKKQILRQMKSPGPSTVRPVLFCTSHHTSQGTGMLEVILREGVWDWTASTGHFSGTFYNFTTLWPQAPDTVTPQLSGETHWAFHSGTETTTHGSTNCPASKLRTFSAFLVVEKAKRRIIFCDAL